MNHLSEDCTRLNIKQLTLNTIISSCSKLTGFNDVCLIILPSGSHERQIYKSEILNNLFEKIVNNLGLKATLITIGETIDLVHIHEKISSSIKYQLWISIKRLKLKYYLDNSALPEYHIGALIHTKYKGALKHTKTRIKYTYCPACDKTTKDYGGKKHTYNSYGTLISDVWRDIVADLDGDMSNIIQRFADLFGTQNYKELVVIDCREIISNFINPNKISEYSEYDVQYSLLNPVSQNNNKHSKLIMGDVLKNLSQLPDNSVDFAFADPPYNLKKKYNDYSDDLSITEYFDWCDEWIGELARILKPGRTCAILNIPLWAIRHFLYMEKILKFQNWIVWDALSFPVRFIMPAHYAILCFSKGVSRSLPGLTGISDDFQLQTYSKTFHPIKPLAEWYCLRSRCVKNRLKTKEINDRGPLTDLWWDIHRLKHNTRRVDHPCQLPSLLMYRLISIFTEPGEIVLDCFNGAGTTTLAARQLGREYIGIELSEKYHSITESRHKEIRIGA
ncbi:site-specific DNA-methyltransferase (adenine-specific) [Candidatus Magnetomoraceae bacterium gMMP-15]